jgi:steroid delta-isomerase-like uncharacterized protein
VDTDPKRIASRFYEAISPNYRPEALDAVMAPDFVGHAGAGANLPALKMALSSFIGAFPDLDVDVVHVICEGDLVSTWITYTGTHQGDFAGVPGSGREIKITGWDLFRVEDGKVAELTQYCDLFTLMNQIGALPTAAPA